MLLALLGYSGVLVVSSAALPISAPHAPSGISVGHPHRTRRSYHSKRDPPATDKPFEPWSPNGVPGHIDLMTNPFFNTTLTNPYDPYTTIQSIPSSNPSYKIAEMGYTRPILAQAPESNTLLNAKPFGWGTKFWILKSHDVDCYAGSEFASSYNSSGRVGTEYPVTLRSPMGDSQDAIFSYCATYDPNPRGSGMTLGAAPCGSISCAPLPLPSPLDGSEDSTSSFPSVSRNPDGTFAPTFFTTRPCNYLDPNCHVSQIFLFNAMTGSVRPMYHTNEMDGSNSTQITGGPVTAKSEPLRRSVEMVFRQGDLRALQGWPDPDPALVVADPAFDRQSGAPPPGFNSSSADLGAWNATSVSLCASSLATAAGLSPTQTSAVSAAAVASSALAVASATQGSNLDVRPVWLVRPAAEGSGVYRRTA